MPDDTTTGIPDPDRPGRWLVPPWPARASFSDIVGHFMRHDPQWRNPSTAQLLAYFETYDSTLENAPADKSVSSFQLRWQEDMRDCVARCLRLQREKIPTETHQEMVS
jgi:hypothetical protein